MKKQFLFLLPLILLTSCANDVSLDRAKSFADKFEDSSIPYTDGKQVSYYSFSGVGDFALEKSKLLNEQGIFSGKTSEKIITDDNRVDYKLSSSVLDSIVDSYGDKIIYTLNGNKLTIKKNANYTYEDESTYSINLKISYDVNGFASSFTLTEKYKFLNDEYYDFSVQLNYHWNSAYIS